MTQSSKGHQGKVAVSRPSLRVRLGLSGLLASILFLPPMAVVAGEPSREGRIKAAIVYKLGKFVEWPESAFADPEAPLRICQLGEDGFSTALSSIAGRIVQGHRVVFQVVDHPVVASLRDCHILYVSHAAGASVPVAIRGLRGHPVLTISDLPDFARNGGMIALVRVGDRLGFEIAPGAARDAKLRVDAQLLDLANIVDGGNRGME